jgi:hypothetical protein
MNFSSFNPIFEFIPKSMFCTPSWRQLLRKCTGAEKKVWKAAGCCWSNPECTWWTCHNGRASTCSSQLARPKVQQLSFSSHSHLCLIYIATLDQRLIGKTVCACCWYAQGYCNLHNLLFDYSNYPLCDTLPSRCSAVGCVCVATSKVSWPLACCTHELFQKVTLTIRPHSIRQQFCITLQQISVCLQYSPPPPCQFCKLCVQG